MYCILESKFQPWQEWQFFPIGSRAHSPSVSGAEERKPRRDQCQADQSGSNPWTHFLLALPYKPNSFLALHTHPSPWPAYCFHSWPSLARLTPPLICLPVPASTLHFFMDPSALLTHLPSLTRKGFFQVLVCFTLIVFLGGRGSSANLEGPLLCYFSFLPPLRSQKWTSLSCLCPLGYMVFSWGKEGRGFPVPLSLPCSWVQHPHLGASLTFCFPCFWETASVFALEPLWFWLLLFPY